jgi:integrase
MATFQRRGKNRRLRIFFYDPRLHKQIQLPPGQIEHLQAASDEDVQAWIDQFEAGHGRVKAKVEQHYVDRESEVFQKYQQFEAFMETDQRKKPLRETTKKARIYFFERHICGFFIGAHGNDNLNRWRHLIPQFHTHLVQKGVSRRDRKRTLGILKEFGTYLAFIEHIDAPWLILPPKGVENSETPLKLIRTPSEILSLSGHILLAPLRLACLIGYFASLRPSEVWALTIEDFLTGAAAKDCRSYQVTSAHGVGSGLSVHIRRTFHAEDRGGLTSDTKSKASKDIVNIWHPDGAKAIAKFLKDIKSGPIFPAWSRGHFDHQWLKYGQPSVGLTMHDLRRSSVFYLGKILNFHPIGLKDYARHVEISTTMLYVRGPNDEVSSSPPPRNFDDIA